MKRRMLQLAALSLSSMLLMSGGTFFAEAVQETELDISFEELAAAAAQGYDGEDIQSDVYTEQDPSFVKEVEVVTTSDDAAEDIGETYTEAAEKTSEETAEEAAESVDEAETENTAETEKTTETEIDERDIFEKSQYTVGFSKTEDIVSIRNSGSIDSDLAGILKPHGMVEIYGETEDGWYEVQAGDIYGYVDKSLIVTDQEARDIAAAVVYQAATPTVKKVKVRSEANEKAKAVLTLKKGEEIEVIDAYSDWITVITSKGVVGYVPDSKVAIVKHYPTGMTLTEFDVWSKDHAPETEETETEEAQEEEHQEEEYQEEEYYEPEQTYTSTQNTYTYTNTNTYTQTTTPETTAATETPATEAPSTEAPATEAPAVTPATEASAAEDTAAVDDGSDDEGDVAFDDTSEEDGSSDEGSDETFVEDEGSDEGDGEDVIYVDDSDSDGGDDEVYDDTAAEDTTYEDGEVYEE